MQYEWIYKQRVRKSINKDTDGKEVGCRNVQFQKTDGRS